MPPHPIRTRDRRSEDRSRSPTYSDGSVSCSDYQSDTDSQASLCRSDSPDWDIDVADIPYKKAKPPTGDLSVHPQRRLTASDIILTRDEQKAALKTINRLRDQLFSQQRVLKALYFGLIGRTLHTNSEGACTPMSSSLTAYFEDHNLPLDGSRRPVLAWTHGEMDETLVFLMGEHARREAKIAWFESSAKAAWKDSGRHYPTYDELWGGRDEIEELEAKKMGMCKIHGYAHEPHYDMNEDERKGYTCPVEVEVDNLARMRGWIVQDPEAAGEKSSAESQKHGKGKGKSGESACLPASRGERKYGSQ